MCPACQTCGNEGESINHVLFSCTLARQVLAISGFPHPRGGFDEHSVYANLNYLFGVWKNEEDLRSITKSFPWLLWYLWKNRNSLLFNGVLFDGEQTFRKALEESDLWLSAQDEEQTDGQNNSRMKMRCNTSWTVPPVNFVKCNIGMKWSKQKMELGAS